MRKSEAPRRSSAFEDLFAERQVYLRSGLTSRYVVLSRPLQIAVTIGVGLIVAGLAFASYSSVVSHLEAGELRRELALAEARLGELSTATGGAAVHTAPAQLAASQSSAGQRIAELTRQLEASDAKADRLQGDLEAALTDAAALRQAAETAEANLADLQAGIARDRPPAEVDASQELAQIKKPGTPEADAVLALEASLARGRAQIAAHSADIGATESGLGSAAEAARGAHEVDRVRAELRAANQRIAELEAAIRLGLAKLAPPPAPPAPR
jgi:TolA-binding protein